MSDFSDWFFSNKAFYGHAGRPGMVGGSVPANQAMSRSTGAAAVARMRGKPGSRISAANPDAPEDVKPASAFGGGKAPENINLNKSEMDAKRLNDLALKSIIGKKNQDDFQNDLVNIRLMKNNIVTELSNRAGVDYEDVNGFIRQWGVSSNDSDLASLYIQKDAAEELGIELSDWQKEIINKQQKNHEASVLSGFLPDGKGEEGRLLPKETQKKLIREMYNLTQERLKKLGYDPDGTIRLYRGFSAENEPNYEKGSVINYVGNAIESWSMKYASAADFMYNHKFGIMFVIDIPVKSVVGSYFSGFGCMNEDEFVIGGLSGAGNQAVAHAIYKTIN